MRWHPSVYQLAHHWGFLPWEVAQWPASLGDAFLAYHGWQNEQDGIGGDDGDDQPLPGAPTHKERIAADAAVNQQQYRIKYGKPTG